MGQPAARIGDPLICPSLLAPGTIIGPGVPTVNIGGLPAATVSSMACLPGEVLIKGSSTVFIGGKPAARMGDSSGGGAVITGGASNVMIGG
jgi:uncharacterized Zn-binding protein involved in type VI secretion